jgi:hypothetical protein
MGLEGERLDDFKALLLERQMANTQKGIGFLSAGRDQQKIESLTDDIKLQREAADEELKAMLSAEEFAIYKAYEETLGERMQVGQLANAMSGAGEPLTDEQTEQLIELMHDANMTHLGEGFSMNDPGEAMRLMQTGEGIDDIVDRMNKANDSMFQQSSSILSATQQEKFTKHQQQQANRMRSGMRMMQAMMNNGEEK